MQRSAGTGRKVNKEICTKAALDFPGHGSYAYAGSVVHIGSTSHGGHYVASSKGLIYDDGDTPHSAEMAHRSTSAAFASVVLFERVTPGSDAVASAGAVASAPGGGGGVGSGGDDAHAYSYATLKAKYGWTHKRAPKKHELQSSWAYLRPAATLGQGTVGVDYFLSEARASAFAASWGVGSAGRVGAVHEAAPGARRGGGGGGGSGGAPFPLPPPPPPPSPLLPHLQSRPS